MLEPTYNAVAAEMTDVADFGEVDIDKAPDVAGSLGIRSVPTVLVIKGDKVVDAIVGVSPKSHYVDAVRKAA